METLLLCLKKSAVTKNPFLTMHICSEITEFISKTNAEERHLLTEQLSQNDILLALNEGITSNVRTLLETLKLLCSLSENTTSKFWEDFWTIMRNISRALTFITNSKEFPETQGEFVELVLMVEILIKRFRLNLKNKAPNERRIQTLKSLCSLCRSVLRNDAISNACKMSVILLFIEILTIFGKFPVSVNSEKTFVPRLLDTFYTMAEFCINKSIMQREEIGIYLTLKMLLELIRLPNIDEYDKGWLMRFQEYIFKSTFWIFLFEKTSHLILADFLITSFNLILWTTKAEGQNGLFAIATDFLGHAGVERLLIVSNKTECYETFKMKIKLLIGAIVVSVIQNHFPTEADFSIVETLLLGNIERFVNVNELECEALTNCTTSFIYIFYVITMYARNRSTDCASTIFQKICLLMKSNYQNMTANVFWMCMSISQIYFEENKSSHKDQLLIMCMKEFFNNALREKYCSVASPQYEHLKWLKEFNEQLFEKHIVHYLDQRLDADSCQQLVELVTPSQIIHLSCSNSYNQIVNTNKLLASLILTGDDIKYLLHLFKANKKMLNGTHLLGLLYVVRHNIANCKEPKLVLNFCVQIINNDPFCYARLSIEIKTLLTEIISKFITLNRRFVKINVYSS